MTEALESRFPDQFGHEIHHLASLVGVLGLRWFAICQALPVELARIAEKDAMDQTVGQLRDSVRQLCGMIAPSPGCPLPSDAAADEGP